MVQIDLEYDSDSFKKNNNMVMSINITKLSSDSDDLSYSDNNPQDRNN